MEIISVINYKGGVGKTTLTANLAAELAYRGKKVLLIDLDPQANLTFSFLKPDYWNKDVAKDHTIRNWFVERKNTSSNFNNLIIEPDSVKPFINEGTLRIVSSHLDLINVDLELATKLGGANLTQAKRNFITTHHRLVDGIRQIPVNTYDIILLDCPPNFNIITKNAIVASSKILIPAKPDYLSTLGIDYLRRSLNLLVKEYNEYCNLENEADDIVFSEINPQIMGVIFTMVQYYRGEPISALRQFIQQTKNLGVHVFDNHVRENKTIFSDAGQFGVPVSVHKQESRPLYKVVINELEALTTEFLENIEA